MLLTLKPPSAFSSPYVYPSPRSETRTYSPSESKLGPLVHTGSQSPRTMSTPHRGLPPPIGMTLPAPSAMSDRGAPPPPPPPQHGPPPMSQGGPMGQLPAPPTTQWPQSDTAMRDWLAAKAEEDRRKQEEERTRQETLRLEQRKIEQSMLRESLQGGIPPHMVPIVFAGMGGGNLANAGLEWASQYMSQMTGQQAQHPTQQQQLPPPHTSPDLRRERAYTGPQPNPYSGHQPPSARSYPFDGSRPGQPALPAPPTSVPRSSASSLSRLNTGDMSIHQPPPPGSTLPTQQSAPSQAEQGPHSTPTASNSIYFHHWVPPNSSKEGAAGSPSEFPHSPKKRKTNSGKTPDISPSFDQPASASRRARALSIQKSEASTDSSTRDSEPTSAAQGSNTSRPHSRHGRKHSTSTVPGSGLRHESAQPETSEVVSPTAPSSAGFGSGHGRKRSRSPSPRRDGFRS